MSKNSSSNWVSSPATSARPPSTRRREGRARARTQREGRRGTSAQLIVYLDAQEADDVSAAPASDECVLDRSPGNQLVGDLLRSVAEVADPVLGHNVEARNERGDLGRVSAFDARPGRTSTWPPDKRGIGVLFGVPASVQALVLTATEGKAGRQPPRVGHLESVS